MNAIDGLIMFLVLIGALCWLAKWGFLFSALFSFFGRRAQDKEESDAERIAQRAIRKASQREL